MKLGIGWGLLLTALVAGILYAVWGRQALIAGASFGLVATAIQAASVLLVRPVMQAKSSEFLGRWALGMGLRMAGVALVGIAAYAAPGFFPPLPTALGFLAVLIPLLFMEVRLIR